MAKIKHTKNELKSQRDSLKRFERYLPTLLLKKQQLQLEVRQLDVKIEEKEAEYRKLQDGLAKWVKLFSEPVDFGQFLQIGEIRQMTGNIAGVNIPVLQDVVFKRTLPDLFDTSSWIDDGIRVLEQLTKVQIERRVLKEQHRVLSEELRTTSQRVNLFEKVKIPECQENIRVIRIFLGDMQTAEVARAKIAKGKSLQKVATS